jgi:hypothetical protein
VALQTYKKVNGHVNVPQSFVVPDNDKWPEEIRGTTEEEKGNWAVVGKASEPRVW